MPKRKPRPITARNACDRMFSEIIRAEGYCRACGTTENLQCAHLISRRYAWTRTKTENAVPLCAKCHMLFHREPDLWMDFIEHVVGRARYDRMKAIANHSVGVKFDWFAERERLKQIHAEVFA